MRATCLIEFADNRIGLRLFGRGRVRIAGPGFRGAVLFRRAVCVLMRCGVAGVPVDLLTWP
ncbi:hypothetical protein RRSWK_03054 [Rhodopirellula sp. SWK7]|nr:hypothetical protein RRSWK_03054 [Rhodopirellula sp. SWK7]